MRGKTVYLSNFERNWLSARFDMGNMSFEGKENEESGYETADRILSKVSGNRKSIYFTADEMEMLAIYTDTCNVSFEGREDKEALYAAAERIHDKVNQSQGFDEDTNEGTMMSNNQS